MAVLGLVVMCGIAQTVQADISIVDTGPGTDPVRGV
jgi:hypothetical protein